MNNAYILYVMEDGVKKVKYSQKKKSFSKMFAWDTLTEKVSEVVTEMFIDASKIIHSMAPYEDHKIYLQARNIFEANVQFQKFNDAKKEKEKHQAADTQLPQPQGLRVD